MNGPMADGYWKAAEVEIETLLKNETWEEVDRESWMNVIKSTWAFKCKRYPDGRVKKLKARFCVRGDQQIQGVDFNETFSPVVSWNTVRLMLILSQVMNLANVQVDYVAAFTQAPIDTDVYCEMPQGFRKDGKVLKLKKSLYGLCQSPLNFYNHLKANLESIGFECQQSVDPCLFISPKCICLVYVDDTLFFAPKPEYIDEAIEKLRATGMVLEREDSVAGFLGVHVDRDETNGHIKLTQKGLIKRIIQAALVEDQPIKHTPAKTSPLVSDKDGEPAEGTFNYASVIGMLLYLSGHSRPDITFAVSQCARFIHGTRKSHERAIQQIARYLKGTQDEGLILKPTPEFNIDCYVDADVAGLYPLEEITDPTCVKSRAGWVVCICNCPVMWASKLMPELCLSTMEAEYCALSRAMKDVIPIQTLFGTLAAALGVSEGERNTFRTTVWEDNMGALTLASMEPGRFTPRSKHYAVKAHWFRSKLKPTRTTVLKIDTSEQRADILTKGLGVAKFRQIRLLLCGW